MIIASNHFDIVIDNSRQLILKKTVLKNSNSILCDLYLPTKTHTVEAIRQYSDLTILRLCTRLVEFEAFDFSSAGDTIFGDCF